jgi:hypothetical protein
MPGTPRRAPPLLPPRGGLNATIEFLYITGACVPSVSGRHGRGIARCITLAQHTCSGPARRSPATVTLRREVKDGNRGNLKKISSIEFPDRTELERSSYFIEKMTRDSVMFKTLSEGP